MILHLGTQIQVVFGFTDADGNVGKKPCNLTLEKLDKAAWIAAFDKLQEIREELKAKQVQIQLKS